MKNLFLKVVSILLIVALCASMFSACGSSEPAPTPAPAPTQTPEENAEIPIEPLIEEDPVVEGLSAEQRASMAMMNYLAYIVEVINKSSRSRVALEEVFDVLENNVEKSSIDATTSDAFQNIFTTIEKYQKNDYALERLNFLSGQDEAYAILALVPNPLEVMDSLAEKGTLRTLAGLAYSTINTVADTSSYTSAEELAYLESKWSLEDAEREALAESRRDMFAYMVEKAQELPKGITLTKSDIEEYVKQITDNGGKGTLSWLEQNQEKYQYFSYYWLDLADCYYNNGDYSKCLAAIETYKANDTGIFKIDERLAESLRYAIIAAKETMSDGAYVTAATNYVDSIVSNIGTDKWDLRYYAVMAYLELYDETQDTIYLDKAYNETVKNVRYLADKQRDENTIYLMEIAEAKAENDKDKEETSIIKNYNKYMREARKVELPPVYGPLLRNCELLFSIAEKKGISDGDKDVIDSILHDKPVFLTYELDKKFSYNRTSSIPSLSNDTLTYSGVLSDQKLTIPAVFAPAGTVIKGEVVTGGQTIALDNWKIDEVDRNKSNNISDFEAVFTCKAPKPIVYKTGDTVTLYITPPGVASEDDIITVKLLVDRLTVGVPHFKDVSEY